MLGQLCPPSLLIALSVLEGLFFAEQGLQSVSLSYAQQTNSEQDLAAVNVLRRVASKVLPTWCRTHVVVYTYMGVYPETEAGAHRLLIDSARLAAQSGAARLIVKTKAEAFSIPSVGDNVEALDIAAATVRGVDAIAERKVSTDDRCTIEAEVWAILDAVRSLSPDVASCLTIAFTRGLLDVPYCLHPDNRGATRCFIDATGRLRWAATGNLPLAPTLDLDDERPVSSSQKLLSDLRYVQHKYDNPPVLGGSRLTNGVEQRGTTT